MITTIYRTSDEKEFTSLPAAQQYENDLLINNWASYIKGLDESGKVIPYTQVSFCSKVNALRFKNYDAFNAFIKRAQSENTVCDGLYNWDTIYAWDDDSSAWIDVQDKIDYHENKMNYFKKLYEKIIKEQEE